MQRWMVGAGVVVVALLGAVLLFPSTDTGGTIDEHTRQEVPVEKLRKADPAALKAIRQDVTERRERLERAEAGKPTSRGTLRGRNVATSERYRLDLAERSLNRKEVWEPWRQLDRALDATESREAMDVRRQLVDLEELTHRAFDDPRRFKDLISMQEKVLHTLNKSPVARDRKVQAALEATIKHHKQFAQDVRKL